MNILDIVRPERNFAMKQKMKKLLFVTLFVQFAFLSPIFAVANDLPILKEVHQKINEEFNRLDAAMKDTAGKLGVSGLTGDGARSSLSALCEKFPFAVDCSAVDAKGILITLEPSPYRHLEGTDIRAQEHIQRVIKRHQPVMSSVFKSIEGFDAVDVEYPVFNPQRKYIGSVSLFFKPETFFAQILPPLIKSIPIEIWVIEKGGRIIYDSDSSRMGQNLFTSPTYRSCSRLQKLGRRIAAKQEGNGSYPYRFHGENVVATKDAYWKSVDLYGTEWRVVGVQVEKEKSGSKMKQQSPSISPEERLETFIKEARLIKTLSKGDKNEAMQLFKAFYKTTPGIYAIEWVDENGINRFGYPAGNSLIDYDYHQKRETGDQDILDILMSQKKASMELPLTEGGAGIFNFAPVLDDNRYFGMIYIIRLK
jgi:hypothetical protein